jgi:DNA-binding transcriptional MerR regulator
LEALLRYMQMLEKGDSTIKERKELLENQREELRQKKALIEHSLERLDYKIDHYDQLMAKKGFKK